jgi:superoxide reductase
MKDPRLFKCQECGAILEYSPEVKVASCDALQGKLKEIKLHTEENVALEKHIPAVEVKGCKVTVTVGDVIHPMTEGHYIQFVYLLTDKRLHKYYFNPGEHPSYTFKLEKGEKPLAAYEYCNLHGYWKKEI